MSIQFNLQYLWPGAKDRFFSHKRMAEANRGSKRRAFLPRPPMANSIAGENSFVLSIDEPEQIDSTRLHQMRHDNRFIGQLQLAWNRVEWHPFGRVSSQRFPASLDRRRARKKFPWEGTSSEQSKFKIFLSDPQKKTPAAIVNVTPPRYRQTGKRAAQPIHPTQ